MDEGRARSQNAQTNDRANLGRSADRAGPIAENVRAKTEEDRMVLFIAGALFGLILGLTASAYAAGVFGTGRPVALERTKGRARSLLGLKR
jgi:hypothetical protein